MAVNVSNRKGNVKNMRSHACNKTRKRQKLNLQKFTDENGRKKRTSVKEIKTLNKEKKAA